MNREKIIQDSLDRHWEFLNKWAEENGYTVAALFLQGSQNYGLDLYTEEYKSDVDTKAIILPKFEDFILNREQFSKTLVLDNDEHCDVKDIRMMFNMFRKANIQYIGINIIRYAINSNIADGTDDRIKRHRIKQTEKFRKEHAG